MDETEQQQTEDEETLSNNTNTMMLTAEQLMTMELVTLTMGQAQAEEIIATWTTKTTNIVQALPLHCQDFGGGATSAAVVGGATTTTTSNSSINILWASKRRAVALTPTAGTIWSALATVTTTTLSSSSSSSTIMTQLVLAHQVLFLVRKHFVLSSSQGPSTSMSSIQAKPYLALGQLMLAVVVPLCQQQPQPPPQQQQQQPQQKESKDDDENTTTTTNDNNRNDTTVVEQLQTQFMDICRQVLQRQVVTAASITSSSSDNSNSSTMIMNSEGSWGLREQLYSVICHLCRASTSSSLDDNNDNNSRDNTVLVGSSSTSNSTSTSNSGSSSIASMETANLLFACSAKEHERLRPKAVAALDALLETFVRRYVVTATKPTTAATTTTTIITAATNMDTTGETMMIMTNPWAAMVVENKEGGGGVTTTTTVTESFQENHNRNDVVVAAAAATAAAATRSRAALARSLLPLLWNAAQRYQPKTSRVAAARWAGELFLASSSSSSSSFNNTKKGLDLVQGCHLLCFLAGDSDVTAASMANQYLFPTSSSSSSFLLLDDDDDNDGVETTQQQQQQQQQHPNDNNNNNDGSVEFSDFATFTGLVFAETTSTSSSLSSTSTTGTTRVQRYWDFSFLGKVAALRYGLMCLLTDLYGGGSEEEEGIAVERYLSAMTKTLDFFANESSKSSSTTASISPDRAAVDLLDHCCACLLKTLRFSSVARQKFANGRSGKKGETVSTKTITTISQLEELAVWAKSSKARRLLAGIVGILYCEEDVAVGGGELSFGDWMAQSGVRTSLAQCLDQLTYIEKSHFQLGKLHGTIFLSGHLLRAIRYRLLLSTSSSSSSTEGPSVSSDAAVDASVWSNCTTRILHLLALGVLHQEEALSNASVDAIGIALSFDSLDAPIFDSHYWNAGTIAVLESFCAAIKKFSSGEGETVVDTFRATALVKAAGTVLGATSLLSTSMTNNNNNNAEDLHKARHGCVQAIFSTLGSMAFRKDEEIALAAGEALGKYADSCNYENSGLIWPDGDEFQEDFSLRLPPHEFVMYYMLTFNLKASSPQKRTATAPALLGLVGRASRLVHSDERNAHRSFIKSMFPLLTRLQAAFVSLLADPKIKHFSRESCCLGLAACRGLATFNPEGTGVANSGGADELNQKLLRAFGQTTNYGGSAYQETRAQAEQRRAAEQTSGRPGNSGDRNILEPFGMESEVEVFGAAGMAEASLRTYSEMAAASLSLGRPDILYALLILSISHTAWFLRSTRDKYNAGTLLGDNSMVGSRTNALELRRALRPHLGKLLPRILRACNDPSKQTRDQMSVLWAGLTGGGAEAREAITEHFLSTLDILIQDASNKLWRARAGATGALADVIVGRDWESFGGGPPVLSDDDAYDDRDTDYAGVRILRLWRVVVRSLDDVRDVVRVNGERLGRALRGLTIRLCDSSVMEKSSGEKLTKEEKIKWVRDASAASATSLRWLVKHGLTQTVADTQGLCVSTLVELIAIAKPAIIEPSLPDVLRSLLLCMSSLEPAALNYVQLRTDNQEGLERARLQLAQSGPLATAVTKCVDLLPNAKHSVQRQVVCELDTALRLSVGFATRAAVADTASMMCSTCPGAFSFPGAGGNSNPSVRLMRAFYYAAERERGQGAKDKMIHALGNLAALCPGGSVRSLVVRACKRYKSSTGNNDDPSSRRAAASALRAIAVRASNQMDDGGASDIWSQVVLPVAFLGQKDSDKKTASLMKEVWDEGSVSVEGPTFGTSREEQLLPGIVKEIKEALQEVSWARRIAGSKALEELCNLGVLAPLPRSVGAQKVSKDDLERAKRRSKACHDAICECTRVIIKPRLWTGKSNMVTALAKLVSEWTAIQAEVKDDFLFGWEGNKGACPWTPISMDLDSENLFFGDGWFKTMRMDTDDENENAVSEVISKGEAQLDSEMSGPESEDKINFSELEDEAADNIVPNSPETSDETSQAVLTFVGLCRVLVNDALPEKKVPRYEISEEYLPYRACCLKAVHDLLKSLPTSDVQHKSFVYEKVGTRLLSCIQANGSDMPPVVVANGIDCLAKCFWDGFGSPDIMADTETVEPVELCVLLCDISGKLQPAWTVRSSGPLALAALVAVCDPAMLHSARIIALCMDCATYACRDKKFWRVREAGLRLVGALVRRAGPSSAQRDNIQLLEAILPHKEDVLRLLRSALTDSEPAVTALSSEVLPLLSWWP